MAIKVESEHLSHPKGFEQEFEENSLNLEILGTYSHQNINYTHTNCKTTLRILINNLSDKGQKKGREKKVIKFKQTHLIKVPQHTAKHITAIQHAMNYSLKECRDSDQGKHINTIDHKV